MLNLHEVARLLVAPGKGILAADESTKTIGKRFEKIQLENTGDNRRAWRTVLFSTPGLERYISGVILYDETIRQRILKNPRIISIIKVDEGVENYVMKPMPGLAERLEEYKRLGAQAAKARATITIGASTGEQILQNAMMQADYASTCQEHGMVPIVEPEVLMDGNHSLETCEMTTQNVLELVFGALKNRGVDLSGIVLKPNMVVPGSESTEKESPTAVAEATLRVLKNTVPPEVPGIAFISGGQSEDEAYENLKAINQTGKFPWRLTFSFGRALQDSALKTWAGKAENAHAAQAILLARASRLSQVLA